MILLKPSATIETMTPDPLDVIEDAGRTCYKSEDAHDDEVYRRTCAADLVDNSAGGCIRRAEVDELVTNNFVSRILKKGHESVIEHASATVCFVVDRGVSHELVRHRLAAFSQESTRYVNYGKRGGCQFIIPPWVEYGPGEYIVADGKLVFGGKPIYGTGIYANDPPGDTNWLDAMLDAESYYLELLHYCGLTPQQARSVLPNSTKTEVVMTCNLREWRHVLRLRTSKAAHPQMREVMIPLLAEFKERVAVIFDDIKAVKAD